MQKESIISRCLFLTNVSTLGLFTLFPFFKEKPVVHKDPYEEETLRYLYKNALITVQEEQASYHNDTLSSKQIRNLNYAYDQIIPANHQEMAFVVACSMSEELRNDVVDEYVRRKEGRESLLPDHPLMALETWAMPDTQRVLIFKEQLQALLKILTGSEYSVSLLHMYRLTFQKVICKINLLVCFLEEWRKRIDYDLKEKMPSSIKVKVIKVLKGEIREAQIEVKSWYGMCPYGNVIDNQIHVMILKKPLRMQGVYTMVNMGCSVTKLLVKPNKVFVGDKSMSIEDIAKIINISS